MFKKHVTRFLSVILIVLVAVGFVSGVGSSTEKLKYSLTEYYAAQNVSDFILKSTKEGGFSDEDKQAIIALYGEENVNTGASCDVKIKISEDGEEQLVRLYFFDDFDNRTVNKFEKTELATFEEEPENPAYVEFSDNKLKGIEDGTEIELNFLDILIQLANQNKEPDEPEQTVPTLPDAIADRFKVTVTVAGRAKSPLTFANDGEPSWTNPEDTEIPNDINGANSLIILENVLYIPYAVIPENFGLPIMPNGKLLKTTDMYVSFAEKTNFNALDDNYKTYVEEQKAAVLEALGTTAEEDDVKFITLYENYSFLSLVGYADKVESIGYILMVAFLFVTALVVLSTMTRLMEEERSQIACLKTLGYSSFKIVFKYILFALIATGLGGGGSYFVGLGLAYLICYVFNYSFNMPPISSHIAWPFFLMVLGVIVVVTLLATIIAGKKMTAENPANLLRPKPPKAGKKVVLERIPFLWNRLSFKYKSTLRNVLRYMGRFIMTVVAVAVSTALVLTGLALLDVCIFGGINSPSVMAIAVVVIVFAGLLTAVVIYTLTNINVSERNRELATLKVLGYHDKEVAGYIYREIYIDTFVGILVGYPLSLLLMLILFSVLGMGSIGGVTWFWWLVAPVVVMFFAFLVTRMLKPKIVRIDMNESLKAIE